MFFQIKCVNEEMHDCNTYDNTGILGVHPYYNNLYIATGFGQYGKFVNYSYDSK